MPLPLGEYRKMRRYYMKYRETMENPDGDNGIPSDGIVIE